jgi:two-component system copper resistance phosphate regulon response regulator CusR
VVDIAPDGPEAMRLIQAGPYDLMVLDLMLPGVDGLRVLTWMRASEVRSPVLILTAKDAVEDRVTGLELGADDYLVKPFAFSELLARVRSILRRPPSPAVVLFE